MEAWYPFSTEGTYIKGILYVLQVFAILQTGFCITVDFMIAMFFWFPAARLEMLGQELQQITHEKQMKICIQKHQEIIRYFILLFNGIKLVISYVEHYNCMKKIFLNYPIIISNLSILSLFIEYKFCTLPKILINFYK